MKEYNGEKVTSSTKARLVPPNDMYEDCMCEIALTDKMLYVLEPVLGTYTRLFSLFVGEIDKADLYTENGRGMDDEESLVPKGLFGLFGMGMMPGIIASAQEDKKRERTFVKYLRFTYRDQADGMRLLLFSEYDSSAKSFLKSFQKLKTQMNKPE